MQEQDTQSLDSIRAVVQKHWGFDTLRPMQAETFTAAVQQRDAVVVIPTGGGKSLCYQAPAALNDTGLTLVVSPLIALMKDQVDALTARGIPSALFNSSLNARQRREVEDGISDNRYRLLYIAPERFPDTGFVERLKSVGVRAIAIDEAHCISHWGHDFRPDYRRLSELRRIFPDVPIHAFTATAPPHVREDIAQQLALNDPLIAVGDFDRPNLTYRVKWRSGLFNQLCEIIDKHRSSAGIVYCIRRRDVEETCADLVRAGYRALPYHAGLTADVRKENQDAFTRNDVEIVVATVAFGMGIDRSDIRFVVHTGMPKSVEAYQQETGRAGRDGLPADCTLFYSTADFMTWKSIVQKSESEYIDHHIQQLSAMLDYCQSPACRHSLLVGHFGQDYQEGNCGACDNCLDENEAVPDSTTTAMKILSAIVRTGQYFGAKYVADVLIGANNEQIQTRGHQSLSVHGLMADTDPRLIRAWIDQLAASDFLTIGDKYRTFSVSPRGWELLRGQLEVRLFDRPEFKRPPKRRARPARSASSASRGSRRVAPCADDEDQCDNELFEALRRLRKELAGDGGIPLYCIVSNKALEHIARTKPMNEEALLETPGIGAKKFAQYGQPLLDCIRQHT